MNGEKIWDTWTFNMRTDQEILLEKQFMEVVEKELKKIHQVNHVGFGRKKENAYLMEQGGQP